MAQPNRIAHPTRNESTEPAAAKGHDLDSPSSLDHVHQNPAESLTRPHTRLDAKGTFASATEKDVEKGPIPRSMASTSIPDGETEQDPNIIDFDGPDDPANPMNWRFAKKWGMVFLVSAITFLTPLASSMFAPSIPEIMREFKSTNDMLRGFMLSVYVLGFAFGPLSTPARLVRRQRADHESYCTTI
jgi:hypothetical protein